MRVIDVLQAANSGIFLILAGMLILNLHIENHQKNIGLFEKDMDFSDNSMERLNNNKEFYKENLRFSMKNESFIYGNQHVYINDINNVKNKDAFIRRYLRYAAIAVIFFGLGVVFKLGVLFKMQTL